MSSVHVDELEVNPNVAARLLSTSRGNRPLHSSHLDSLVDAMRNGEWRERADPIKIDEEGRLIDGHHRLTAVIKSGATIRITALYGIAVDAIPVLDCGQSRTLAYRVGEDKRLVAVVTLALAITYDSAAAKSIERVRRLLASPLGVAAETVLTSCRTKRRYVTSAPMHLAATLMLAKYPCMREYILQTWSALALAEYGGASTMALALVKQLSTGRINSTDTRDTLARGLQVFDEDEQDSPVLRVTTEDVLKTVQLVRSTVKEILE